MKGIDHLVLCGRDLQIMRETYGALGFTLTPRAQHPFGTCNSLIQLDHVFLELLSIDEPAQIPQHAPGHFSFGAFNRDFLTRGEGFSMLVLDSDDARRDVALYRERGLKTYEPFDFTRQARLPGGETVQVGFSLAFVSTPRAPMCGFFACQHHAPQYFWQRAYQDHPNGAWRVEEVALVAERPEALQDFLEGFASASAMQDDLGIRLMTARGAIVVMTPQHFGESYGVAPPSLAEGPRFAGYVISPKDPSRRPDLLGKTVHIFGTALRFELPAVAARARHG